MKIDLAKYKVNIPSVRKICNKHPNKLQSDLAQIVTEITTMPLLVSCYFVAGVMNKTDEDLRLMIDRLMVFYDYEPVIPLNISDYEE